MNQKRLRPQPETNLSVEKKAQLRKKWRGWIRRISDDLGRQLLHNETYQGIVEAVRENPRIQKPGDIHRWMAIHYVAGAVIGIRRLVDRDSRSPSFWRLLFELLQYPSVLTRASHGALYRANRYMADRTFDAIVGRGRSCLGPGVIRRDLRLLEDTADRIHRFANKRVAHLAPRGAIRKLPTFIDLTKALNDLDKLARRYNTLLTASGLVTLKPTRTYSWRSVLYEPWVPPERSKK